MLSFIEIVEQEYWLPFSVSTCTVPSTAMSGGPHEDASRTAPPSSVSKVCGFFSSSINFPWRSS